MACGAGRCDPNGFRARDDNLTGVPRPAKGFNDNQSDPATRAADHEIAIRWDAKKQRLWGDHRWWPTLPGRRGHQHHAEILVLRLVSNAKRV